jgi:hypothetical protein
MKHFGLYGIIIIIAIILGGCDASVNPLVFDGAPLRAIIEVDEESSSYQGSEQVNLGAVLSGVDELVDSITVYNITLRIDPLAGTPANLSISGSIQLDNNTLFSLSNLPVSEFQSERSIFDNALTQYVTVSSGGVAYLQSLLAQSPLPSITFAVWGQASGTPVRLRFTATVYTQVFTEP